MNIVSWARKLHLYCGDSPNRRGRETHSLGIGAKSSPVAGFGTGNLRRYSIIIAACRGLLLTNALSRVI